MNGPYFEPYFEPYYTQKKPTQAELERQEAEAEETQAKRKRHEKLTRDFANKIRDILMQDYGADIGLVGKEFISDGAECLIKDGGHTFKFIVRVDKENG